MSEPLEKYEEELKDLFTEEELRFVVDNDDKAEWCMKMIRDLTVDEKKWIEFYNGQIEKVKKNREIRVAFIERLLRHYFDMMPHKKTKTQENYPLPSGKLVLKRQDPEFDTEDPAFLNWLKECKMDEYIQVKESPKWGDFKKTLKKNASGEFVILPLEDGNCHVVTTDGVIVPGVKATVRPDVFCVEVKS